MVDTDGVGGFFDQVAVAVFTFLEGGFEAFRAGDIGMGAAHEEGFAIGGAGDELAAVGDPDPAAVFMAHAGLVVVVVEFTVEVLLEEFAAGFQVVWVCEVDPSLDRDGLEFSERIAEDIGPAFVENGFAGLDVPFPGADLGTFDDGGEAGAFEAEGFGGLLLFGDIAADAEDEFLAVDCGAIGGDFDVDDGAVFAAVAGLEVVAVGAELLDGVEDFFA